MINLVYTWAIGMAIGLEGKLYSKPIKLHLKNWPCVTFCLWQRGWVNTYDLEICQAAENSLDLKFYPLNGLIELMLNNRLVKSFIWQVLFIQEN